jgi:hypothetical protein
VLQLMVMPLVAEPITVQTPAQFWMQSHDTGEVPHVLGTHSARNAPPARTRQSSPAAQTSDDGLGQVAVVHALVLTDHLGSTWPPPTQAAIVRPAPAQSS